MCKKCPHLFRADTVKYIFDDWAISVMFVVLLVQGSSFHNIYMV